MILVIDNYDSFTYNLVQYLGELGTKVMVARNDAITLGEIENLAPERILLSPGPCTPNEAGITLELISQFAPKIPILGVCLGHQAIGQCFGGKIAHAKQVMHGKTSLIYHQGLSVFKNCPSPFQAGRYHSLIIEKDSLPDSLEITAWTKQADGQIDEIMGIKHTLYPLHGVQFHPESILSEHGHQLLKNFLEYP